VSIGVHSWLKVFETIFLWRKLQDAGQRAKSNQSADACHWPELNIVRSSRKICGEPPLANMLKHIPNPGSAAAQKAGCTCAVLDNRHGRGLGRGKFYISADCPLHDNPKPRKRASRLSTPRLSAIN